MTNRKMDWATRRRVAALTGAGVLAVGAIAWAAAPSNDAFAAATVLTGAQVSVVGTNVDATAESGEPDLYGAKATVWYSWTAPAKGKYRFRLTPGAGTDENFSPWFRVYTGASVDALTTVNLGYSIESDYYYEDALYAVAGTTYRFRVDSNSGYYYDPATMNYQLKSFTGPFSLTLDVIPAPVNDDFDDALILTGETVATGGVNEAGTVEPGEPQHDVRIANGHSVWYRWTAPRSGRVLLSTYWPMGVYTGTAVNALTRVARTDADGSEGEGLSFDAVAGTTYSIALDGGDEYGEGTFGLRSVVRPANDDRANATVVSGTNVFITGTSALSTHEPGEPANFLIWYEENSQDTTPGSVWYSWTAPVTGRVRLSGLDYGYVGVFTGAVAGPLTRVEQRIEFDDEDSYRVEVYADVVAGTRYLVALDANSGATPFAVRLTYSGANDAFDDAIDLAGPVVSTSGSNVGATREIGEPYHGGMYGGSVWWEWVATTTGDVLVSTAGSDFDTMLAVYSGTSVRTLDRVAENDDAGDTSTSRAAFHATAGVVYHVCVTGATRIRNYDPDEGSYLAPEATGVVHLSIRPGAANLAVTLAADPAAAKVDEAVVFSANAPGAGEFRWDFGDGKVATTLAGEATHSYDSAGTFHVIVTAADGANQAVANLDVAVAQDLPCVVNAFAASLNFRKANADAVTITGSIALPAGIAVSGQSFSVDVGGVKRSFTLDAKGAARVGNDSVKVTAKPGQNAKFVLRFAKGSFQADLADEGLENSDASGEPVLVDVTLVLGGMPFDTTVQAFWTGKQGKAGVAR